MSDSFPLTGVITAPATRYTLRIQDEELYDKLKSCIRCGSAGRSIVSVYMEIVAIELRIARVVHIEILLFFLLNKVIFFVYNESQGSIYFILNSFKKKICTIYNVI